MRTSPGLAQVAFRHLLAVCCLAAGLSRAAAQEEGLPMGWCLVGASSASNAGSASSTIREYPGVNCTMNVGVLVGDYGLKVPNCSGLNGRREGLTSRGIDCDTITLIELNSDVQCHCACGQYASELERMQCEANDWRPDAERCAACNGCGGGSGAGSCRQQAEVICPPKQYEIECSDGGNIVNPIGCDCTCRKKGPCTLDGGTCTYRQVRPSDPRCGNNNSASCTLCDNAPSGPSTATCNMHPDHCEGWEPLGFPSFEACFAACSTGLVDEVLATVAGYDIKTLMGDWNCSATADCDDSSILTEIIGLFKRFPIRCPFFDRLANAGLEVCGSAPYILPSCALDFVVSNWCGCGDAQWFFGGGLEWNLNYDHPTTVFGTHRAYGLYDDVIIEAHSEMNCGGSRSYDPASDRLGAQCAIEGWSPSWCEGSGSTSRGMLMYKRRNECPAFYQRFGNPRVLACDVARASASASCGPIDSARTSIRQTIENATVTAAASCSGGCGQVHNPLPVLSAERDEALPLIVNGEESFVVTRIWSRERGPTRCQNTWPPLCGGPGTQPPTCGSSGGGNGGGTSPGLD